MIDFTEKELNLIRFISAMPPMKMYWKEEMDSIEEKTNAELEAIERRKRLCNE